MSATSISAFLAAFETIRNQPQPYSALSDYLASIVATPRWKNGIQVLPFSSIGLNLLLLSTASATCLVRIRFKTFNLGSINQDHILRPNSGVCWALGCIVFSVLSVVETVMWILGNHVKGIDNMHGRAALAGIKFVFLWEGAWCFSWSSAGHYICSKWRPPWQPADMHSKIPALLVWCLNTTFIVAALAALLFPLITFTMVELRAQDLISSVASVCIRLRRLDEHKVVKFEFSTAMVVLRPLLHSLPKLVSIIKLIRLGVIAWFLLLCLILSVQLIFICLASAQRRVLGPKDSFWTTIVRKVIYKANNLTSTSSAQKPAFNYAREQNVLILISLIILISGTAFMPVPILEYRNATIENIAGVTDQLMTDLISTFVASTISNILMLLVLLQTIRLSTPKYSSGSQTTVRSDDFRMTLSSKHISVHPPHENRMHPGFTPSFEDPEKGLRTDYEKWTQDTLSKGNCADEASEITLLEGSTAV